MSYGSERNEPSGADSDAHLVLSSQKGDTAAFETLVVRHQKRMFNVAFRLLNDYDEACEVVQDVFVSAYKNIRAFRGDSKFTTWLTAITLNLSKNRLKQIAARQSRVAYSLDDPVPTDNGTLTRVPPSKEPSVLDHLEQQDVLARVLGCIEALSTEFREVIVLRDMQDFSYDEIGSMLNVREGTVKSRLFRARDTVTECLKKALGER